MKFTIRHEIRGRIRVHLEQPQMSCRQADILAYYLEELPEVQKAKVYERTADAAIFYTGDRCPVLQALAAFQYGEVEVPEQVLENSGRQLNAEYQEKLMRKVLLQLGKRFLLPAPVRALVTGVNSLKYLRHALCCLARRRLEVPVLDATAIGASVLRGDTETAGTVMFLLDVGEILEEWTHKKSVRDLARSMSLQVSQVWQLQNGQEVLVPASRIRPGDQVVVHMGNVIPFDGEVTLGEGMLNQASLTGESLPVRKTADGYVYAGTVLEEGELTIRVREISGSTRFEKIVSMIEETEKLKSAMESRAEHLADRLVPYTFAGTILTGLLTRNMTKALSVLMVDFSCALKLSMPLSVLSAIREAGNYHITVKGGKYLEAVADADTIVFDKTGTLTKAKPTVKQVLAFGDHSPRELLRAAACLEEHFPHSMAKAVVAAAQKQGLEHEEMHSQVNYIVAHGISSSIEGRKVVIGSHHFVFEDEQCTVREEYREAFEKLPEEYSHLYLAMDGVLEAVICIEDPLREEAVRVLSELRAAGFRKLVMMTGDSERTAAAIAARVGVDHYDSEVLPEDKARFVDRERSQGHVVVMVGDGVNDSPALSAANVGIAVSKGAEIAREIADITITEDSLEALAPLKHLSTRLMKRIQRNYRLIVAINTGLILLGVGGILQPATSALLHNASTLFISLESMRDLL